MEQELDAPETNHTLELTNLPIEKNNYWENGCTSLN